MPLFLQATPKNYPAMLENIKVKWLYCKRGYFRWGEIRKKVAKTFHVGVIFTILLLFPQ